MLQSFFCGWQKYLLCWKVEENNAKVESDSKDANNPKIDGTWAEHLEEKNIIFVFWNP